MSEPEIDVSAVELEVLRANIPLKRARRACTSAGMLGARVAEALLGRGLDHPGVAFAIPPHIWRGHVRSAIADAIERTNPALTVSLREAQDGRHVARLVIKAPRTPR